MTYYKAKKEFRIDNFTFIENELLTQKEINRILKNKSLDNFINNFDIVNINKFKTYWFFGMRKEIL